jgi:hypothetical protein
MPRSPGQARPIGSSTQHVNMLHPAASVSTATRAHAARPARFPLARRHWVDGSKRCEVTWNQ